MGISKKSYIFAPKANVMATALPNESYPQTIPMMDFVRSLSFTGIEKGRSAPPCRYTIEQAHERLDRAMEDIRAGRTFTTEEVFRPYEKWL
jgi:hypothetical protein